MLKTLQALILSAVAVSWSASAQLTDTTIVTNRVSVPASTASNWTDIPVSCPAGLVALSGGVSSNDFTTVEVTTLAPTFGGSPLLSQADGNRGPASGWYASVKNYDAVAHPIAVVIVCASLSNALVTIASANVPSGSAGTPAAGGVSVQCPIGYSAVGGGIDVAQPASMKVSSLSPIFGNQYLFDRAAGLGGAPTGWNGNIRNEGVGGVIKVAAVCAPLAGVTSAVTARFSVGSGLAAGNSVACPAGSIALGGGIDTADVTKNVISVSTPLFGVAPALPIDRGSGSDTTAPSWYAIYYNYGPGATTANVAVVCAPPTAGFVLVYEFYNTGLKHYFRTSSAAEAAGVDNGSAGPNWIRTGDNFYAYLPGSTSPGSDVCRFYTFGANSHFYTAFANECAGLKAPNSGWVYEGLSFRIPLPSGTSCIAGTKPVYRLYNNRFAFTDSNHRFTTDFANVAPLQNQGWSYEGVAFCAPVL